jgi:hypothetical protein
MFVRHDSIQELPGAPQHAPFPTAPSRVACLPEYFMYCNYLKRLGTRQVHTIEIVNSDVNIYQLLVSGFVLSWFSFQIFNMIIQICIMYDNLNVVQ